VLHLLPPGSSVRVIGWVGLAVVQNRGSAFGLVHSRWLLVGLGAAASAAILAYAFRHILRRRPSLAPPLALIVGGSLGNMLDRLRTGAVTDFVDVRVWPVFNVADIAVTVGAAWLAVQLLIVGRKARGG